MRTLECMRSTVRLPDDLPAEARRAAQEDCLTLTSPLEEALREPLARRRTASSVELIRLHTMGRGGIQAGVDPDDASALLDLMESK